MLARAITARFTAISILSRTKPGIGAYSSLNGSARRLFSASRTLSLDLRIKHKSIQLSEPASDLQDEIRINITNPWFRDNCHCASCVNQETLQRNVDIFEVRQNIYAKEVTKSDSGVQILWSDDHVSVHPWTLLKGAMPNATRSIPRDGQIPFDSTIAEKPREISYDAVMNETDSSGMAKLTNDIHVHGFCFVVDTPVTPEATEKLLEKIGPIRNTHYGGFYDFIPDQAMADTAYTNIALAAHTDTTYFSEPARLQAFHMLSHQQPPDYTPEEGELGGRSLLVDGFKAAEDLLSRDPASYSILQNTHIPWHASGNDGITIAPYKAFPVIETMDTGKRIRWNNGDRGVIDWRASRHWYHAAEKFDSFVKDPHNEYWFQLRPGRVLIFDNWRVLHGRSAFLGMRRICGGYISHDDFVSRWKMSNFPRETAIMDSLQLPAERSKKGGQQGRSRPKQAKSKRVNNNRTLV